MSTIWTPAGDDPTRIGLKLDPRKQRMHGLTYHGNKSFDVPYISQILPDLWMGGCTDGLVLPDVIEHLVSLYPWESYTINHELKSILAVRMHDSHDQSFEQVNQIAMWVNACRRDGPTLVHCQAGLNRSGLITARALMLDGMTGTGAIALLRQMRSNAVLCNASFEEWLTTLEDLDEA